MKAVFAVLAGSMLALSGAAFASQGDYYLKIDGIGGETAVAGWSFEVCQTGQCSTVRSPRDAASGLATGKRREMSSGTEGIEAREARSLPTRSSKGTVKCDRAAGGDDNDCPGRDDDFAFSARRSEVTAFTLYFDTISTEYRQICDGKHFDKVDLRVGADLYEIIGATVTCTTGDAKSSNPRQMQGAKRCDGNVCGVDDWQEMAFIGGQLKHTKTGHVTLLR